MKKKRTYPTNLPKKFLKQIKRYLKRWSPYVKYYDDVIADIRSAKRTNIYIGNENSSNLLGHSFSTKVQMGMIEELIKHKYDLIDDLIYFKTVLKLNQN